MAQQGSILIVDDEAGPRESLRMILKPVYKIYTAANGKEALALIQKENIDLVIAQDLITAYLGPEGMDHLFRVFESIILRVKRPESICVF